MRQSDDLADCLIQIAKTGAYEQGATTAVFSLSKAGVPVIEYVDGVGTGSAGQDFVATTSRFNIYSIRKAYIGLALAILMDNQEFPDIDEPVLPYVARHKYEAVSAAVTFRHIVTHTHGMVESHPRQGVRQEFSPGEDWIYNNVGVQLVCDAVERVVGQTIAEVITERILIPTRCYENEWQTHATIDCVRDIWHLENSPRLELGSNAGDDRNFYVSVRDLQRFAELHCSEGRLDDREVVPRSIIQRVTSLATPRHLVGKVPHHGFFWWLNSTPSTKTEIGEMVPLGSYQIVGMNGSLLLVIPKLQAVAIRLMNKVGTPVNYDRYAEYHRLGNAVAKFLAQSPA